MVRTQGGRRRTLIPRRALPRHHRSTSLRAPAAQDELASVAASASAAAHLRHVGRQRRDSSPVASAASAAAALRRRHRFLAGGGRGGGNMRRLARRRKLETVVVGSSPKTCGGGALGCVDGGASGSTLVASCAPAAVDEEGCGVENFVMVHLAGAESLFASSSICCKDRGFWQRRLGRRLRQHERLVRVRHNRARASLRSRRNAATAASAARGRRACFTVAQGRRRVSLSRVPSGAAELLRRAPSVQFRNQLRSGERSRSVCLRELHRKSRADMATNALFNRPAAVPLPSSTHSFSYAHPYATGVPVGVNRPLLSGFLGGDAFFLANMP